MAESSRKKGKTPRKQPAGLMPPGHHRRSTDVLPRPREVMITGFPGFIGRRLVKELLLEEPETRVTALVEERQASAARRFLDDLPDDHAARVTVLTGDVVSMDLGLSGEEFQELTSRITHIFHLAAIHKLKVDELQAERVNVGGTRTMLEFARECRHLERLTHFSSCYVSGDRIGVITEDDLSCGQSFRNAYEATKYKAEVLCRAAMSDLPITVLRPSIVVGDSDTGEIDRLDGIYQVGVLVAVSPIFVPLPLPGDGVAPLNMVPVDFVVRAAVDISRDERAVGKTFHVVDPNPLSSRKVYELMAERAGRRAANLHISTSLTRWLIRLPGLDYLAPQGVQALHYLNHLAIYNSPNTLEILHGTGTMCPRFESYADKLMEYLRRRLAQGPAGDGDDPLDVTHGPDAQPG